MAGGLDDAGILERAAALSTDAHSTGELKLLRFGVGVARRAWLTRENVINTLPSGRLLKVLGQVH